jgi:hypothetical protein
MAKRIVGEPYFDTLQARIRPGKDDDLAEALGNLPACTDVSDLTRTALRLWFGMIKQSQITTPATRDPVDVKPATEQKKLTPDLVLVAKEKNMEASLDKLLELYS